MIKRITAIMALVLTLCLFAFPVFAAAYNFDDIAQNKVGTFSDDYTYDNKYIDLILDEGLYVFVCDLSYTYWGESGELFGCDFYVNKKYGNYVSDDGFLYQLNSNGKSVFYIYIDTPVRVGISDICSSLSYTVDIYSTVSNSSNDRYDEGFEAGKNQGYTLGHIDGYDKGYGLGYTDGERAGYDDAIDSAREQVYENAYNTGYLEGDRDGYERGWEQGYESGEDLGYSNGFTTGKNEGLSEGYENGHTDGRLEGLEDGYENGYGTGKNDGYEEGRQTAQDAAYNQGKQEGWNEAIQDSEEVKTAIGGLFSGIFDGIVDSFNELTEGVTLMGLTLKQILLTIAGIGIIGLVIVLLALKK